MPTEYKYGEHLTELSDCPPEIFAEGEGEAYRFVFSADLASSFLPPLALNPKRALRMSDVQECEHWALSFFTSDDSASQLFHALEKSNRNVHKTLGESLATGRLALADGVMSNPDGDGHFDLHEYREVDIASRFSLVRSLV